MAMLANVHLAGNDDNDDDLYSGFGTEEVAPELQTEDLEFDEGFQVRLRIMRNCTVPYLNGITIFSNPANVEN